ncbi:MAG: DUF4268 domain-containing protein [Symbiobacteriaceae bacterium]|nr:DUF4268 domain-containing protein [Symbiobacteriaceae bacterium]
MSERRDLQEWIVDHPSILRESLLIIQKEFDGFPGTNERLDLLALDEAGRLVIIENKLDDSGRDVVWQALKYVSYCATLTKKQIIDIFQRYLGSSSIAEDKLCEFFDNADIESIRLNPSDGDQRIILVAANFRREVTATVLWLRDHGIDIKCIKVTPFQDGERLYLDIEQILPIQDIGEYQISLTNKKQEEAVSRKEEASRHTLRLEFWTQALPVIAERCPIFTNRSPSRDNWISGASGRSGVQIVPVILMHSARAEVYIDMGDWGKNKDLFDSLLHRRLIIEKSLGYELEWSRLTEKRGCRIFVGYSKSGLLDKENWSKVTEFLAEHVTSLYNCFLNVLTSI